MTVLLLLLLMMMSSTQRCYWSRSIHQQLMQEHDKVLDVSKVLEDPMILLVDHCLSLYI
jgi:uncharacterized protein YggT (Ycf19 family)